VPEEARDIGRRLWPDCVWSLTSHDAIAKDALFRHGYWYLGNYRGKPVVRGYGELLEPRGKYATCFWGRFGGGASLSDCRGIVEQKIMTGHDGLGGFGADLFPLEAGRGRYDHVACGWPRAPKGFTLGFALVYPGPDGPVATERYEMFREGVQLCEALLYVERAIQDNKLDPELRRRAQSCLEDRGNAFITEWYVMGNVLPPEQDGRLLELAGEVAREVEKGGK
jgi:hypothetical protein